MARIFGILTRNMKRTVNVSSIETLFLFFVPGGVISVIRNKASAQIRAFPNPEEYAAFSQRTLPSEDERRLDIELGTLLNG